MTPKIFRLHQYCYLLIITVLISCNVSFSQELAFPSAKGAGAYATGGRGGQVLHITTLVWDAGPGSLRHALFQTTGPRTIVFDVSGEIDATGYGGFGWAGGVPYDNFTIAGQTAPEGGITILTDRFTLRGTNNFIIRYVRFRKSTASTNMDVFATQDCSNFILDHVTFSNGSDECIDINSFNGTGRGTSDITVQNCFFQDSKTGAIIGDGASLQTGNFTLVDNLWANISHRHPNCSGGPNSRHDVVNNVVYNNNYRTISVTTNSTRINSVNNYIKPSANGRGATSDLRWDNMTAYADLADNSIYASGNYIATSPTTTDQEYMWQIYPDVQTQVAPSKFTNTQLPLVGEPFAIKSPQQAYDDVVADLGGGANKYLNADGTPTVWQDQKDSETINMVINDSFGTEEDTTTPFPLGNYFNVGGFITRYSNVGWYPIPSNSRPTGYDTDLDGMPNVWELANGLNPDVADNNGTDLHPYYTNLEMFFNGVDGAPVNIPQITRTDTNPTEIPLGGTYLAPEGTWTDVEDGSGIASVGGDVVDVNTPGDYVVTLFHTDSDGYTGTLQIVFTVVVNIPEITRTDSNATVIELGGNYVPPTGIWTDVEDGTGAAALGGDTVNVNAVGTYDVTLEHTDTDGNTGSLTIPVTITPMISESWNSYDTQMSTGNSQATLTGSNGTIANLEFYESTDNNGVAQGNLFTDYNIGAHPDAFNNAEMVWSNDGTYPYVAKSTVGRGSDDGEGGTPSPFGVNDLQMHPPSSDNLTVSAFVAPVTGEYQVLNLAARRVSPNVGGTSFKVFDQNQNLIAELSVDNQTWVTNSDSFILNLSANDRIYFAADREDIYNFDALEVSWTVNLIQNGTIDVTGVEVTPETAEIEIPDTLALTATVLPNDATNQSGTWSSSNQAIATVDANGVVTPISEGIVTITFTTTDGGFTDSAQITVFPEAFAANAGPDQDICLGDSVTLSASGGTTYLWNNGETTPSIEVSPTVTTTYTVTVSDDLGNTDTDSVTVTVNAIPIADAGNDLTICEGETAVLTASGGDSYLWITGETTASINLNPTTQTTYTVEVSSNSCTSTDDVIVFVNETPTLTITEDITIVEGDSIQLTVEGADDYLWNTGATSSTIDVSPAVSMTYTVIGTIGNCSAQAQVTVTVEPLFIASAGEDQDVCLNDSYEVVLTATSGESYLWSTGETTQSIIVSPLSTSTYTVTVYQGIQEYTDDVTVYVNPSPEVVILNGDSVDIMSGDFVTLSATGANTYQWNNGATQPNIAVSPTETTTYEVRGYIGDCYDEKQVTVNVIPEVVADAGEDVEICLGDVVTLTATGGDDYVWSTGETTQSIQVSPTETTDYTVTVFNALDFDEDTVTVFVDTDCTDEDPIEEPIDPNDPLDFSFSVYPNPASEIVNIRLSGTVALSRVYLYDITGKLIHSERMVNDNLSISSQKQIDISALHPGIYFIKMTDVNREISKQLIIR